MDPRQPLPSEEHYAHSHPAQHPPFPGIPLPDRPRHTRTDQVLWKHRVGGSWEGDTGLRLPGVSSPTHSRRNGAPLTKDRAGEPEPASGASCPGPPRVPSLPRCLFPRPPQRPAVTGSYPQHCRPGSPGWLTPLVPLRTGDLHLSFPGPSVPVSPSPPAPPPPQARTPLTPRTTSRTAAYRAQGGDPEAEGGARCGDWPLGGAGPALGGGTGLSLSLWAEALCRGGRRDGRGCDNF